MQRDTRLRTLNSYVLLVMESCHSCHIGPFQTSDWKWVGNEITNYPYIHIKENKLCSTQWILKHSLWRASLRSTGRTERGRVTGIYREVHNTCLVLYTNMSHETTFQLKLATIAVDRVSWYRTCGTVCLVSLEAGDHLEHRASGNYEKQVQQPTHKIRRYLYWRTPSYLSQRTYD